MKLSGFFIVFIVIIVEIAFCKLNAGEKHKNGKCRFNFTSYYKFILIYLSFSLEQNPINKKYNNKI